MFKQRRRLKMERTRSSLGFVRLILPVRFTTDNHPLSCRNGLQLFSLHRFRQAQPPPPRLGGALLICCLCHAFFASEAFLAPLTQVARCTQFSNRPSNSLISA